MPCRATNIGLRQLFLVVEPKFEWDAGAVKRRERAVKRAKIAAAELFRTSPLDDNSSRPTEGPWVRRPASFCFVLQLSFGFSVVEVRGAAAVLCFVNA